MADPARLIAFHAGTAADHRGRSHADILAFTDEELEYHHDFIQWFFPLEKPSPVNPAAPVLTAQDIGAFANRAALRAALVRALDRMLRFYGFERSATEGAVNISPGTNWSAASANWLTRGNHFLRITRILHSLSLLGHAELAAAFLVALERVYEEHRDVIGHVSIGHWRGAGRTRHGDKRPERGLR